jgi:hypothetical protein
MTCDTMRELILEADLAELRGEADTPLARHLASCVSCQAVAKKIVDTEAALGHALDSIASGVRSRTGHRRSRRIGHWAALVPLAAAAALVAIFVRDRLEAPTVPAAPYAMEMTDAPLLETTDNQDVAIFTTDDPDIVVIWFLGGTD